MDTLPVHPASGSDDEPNGLVTMKQGCCAAPVGGVPCACSTPAVAGQLTGTGPQRAARGLLRRVAVGLVGGAAWVALYLSLGAFARFVTYDLLRLTPGTHLASAVEFFVFEAPKVLLLLTVVVFAVGIVRSFFTPERTRRILAGQRESVGNVAGRAARGRDAVLLVLGGAAVHRLRHHRACRSGVTFSFLISAPMVNEIALVLLFSLFGWKVAALYMGTGLAIAIVAGWVIGRLHMERHVESWVYEIQTGERPEIGRVHDLGRPGPLRTRRRARHRRQGVAVRACRHRRRRRHPRLGARPASWPRSWARAPGGPSRSRS